MLDMKNFGQEGYAAFAQAFAKSRPDGDLLAELELCSGAVAGRVMALVATDFLQREQQFLELQLRRVFHVILPKKILSKAKRKRGREV